MKVEITIKDKSFHRTAPHGRHCVIKNFTLTLDSGEYCCMVGPSGCGKSTLLHIIAGLDTHYDGSIQLTGSQIKQKSGCVTTVFQTPRLLPWRTIKENVDLAMRGYDKQPEMTIDALLEFMGLFGIQHHYPEQLSLGMNRRAALVRALATSPEVLLMDEPLVSLDAPTARRIRQLLLDAWGKRPHTVFHITHDVQEALTLADRILFVDREPLKIIHELRIVKPRIERNENNWADRVLSDLRNNHAILNGFI